MIANLIRDKFLLSILVLSLLPIGWFGYFASDGARAIVLRNSLISEQGESSDFDWSPSQQPPGFREERGDIPGEFVNAVSGLKMEEGKGLNAAIEIARHLTERSGDGYSIRSNTTAAYRLIRETGTGYCSDYTQVFTALAHVHNLDVREWGFALDDYGGGHAFNEVFDESLDKWVFVDVFSGFYLVDRDTQVPISVLELRELLLAGRDDTLEFKRFRSERFDFRDEAQAWEFYTSGAQQMYLWWGNDVFTYEADGLVRAAGNISRMLEQLVAIALDKHLTFRVIATDQSASDWEQLKQIQRVTYAGLLFLVVGFVLLAGRLLYLLRLNSR